MLEENRFSLDDIYSALLKDCYVSSMNFGEVSCGPFLLSRLKIDEYRKGIGFDLIIIIPVEDAVFFVRK